MRVDKCRSCGAEIIWTRTVRGGKMPIDTEQVFGGTFTLDEEELIARYAKPDKRIMRYISHFATCKNAGGARK